MAEIRLKKVLKTFGNFTAVDRIDLSARDKEFLVLVGSSGCGKTTTLRMIAGLEDITEGEIYIGDKKINEVPPKERDIAMVFQNYALYPHMNVYKNMAFGLRFRKYPKDQIDDRVREVAKTLGIEDLLGRKPKELSGGQRQRVAMGRAIVRKPKAFLFDEPLSNLDAKLRVQMRAELAKLHQRLETTIVYVTHDQVEAMTLGDRIAVMDQGLVMQIGAPLEVYNNPKNLFVAGFIGSPAMNLFNVRIVEENDSLLAMNESFKLAIPRNLHSRYIKAKNQETILGIRPEHFFDRKLKEPFPGGERLNATVDVVEPVGSEVNLIASSGSMQFTAKVDSQTSAREYADMEFIIDMNRIYLFDRSTEKAY